MKRNWKILKIIGWGVAVLIVIVYLILPAGIGFFATLRYPETVGSAPAGMTEITFSTIDQVKLNAWYCDAQNGKTILLVHGATDSREGVRKQAEFLVREGYGVLAYDQRGHGESGGDTVNGFGWQSELDLSAAIGYIRSKQPDVKIGAWGFSMGGEALMSAASRLKLNAMIIDGATFRSTKDYIAIPSKASLFVSFTTRVMYASAQLFGQTAPPTPMIESILKADATHFLFIAAGNKQNEIEYNTFFNQQIPYRSGIWVAPNVGHIKAYETYTAEYELQLMDFFDAYLQ